MELGCICGPQMNTPCALTCSGDLEPETPSVATTAAVSECWLRADIRPLGWEYPEVPRPESHSDTPSSFTDTDQKKNLQTKKPKAQQMQ